MPQNTTDLLARAHHARMEVRRIEREMRECVCQHELAGEILTSLVVGEGLWWRQFVDRDGRHYEHCDPKTKKILPDWQPCWKGWWSDETGVGYTMLGDGDRGTCEPCQKRETIRKNLEPARRRLAGLKSAIWAAAKTCVEGER